MLTKLVDFQRVSKLIRVPTAAYNIWGKPFEGLDPSKHIYMNKAMQNQYEDFFRLGDFPWVEDFPQMVDSTEYHSLIVNIIEAHLKERHPNSQFSASAFLQGNQWAAFWHEIGIKDINQELPALLFKFSEGIVVKQSKLSWTKEQRLRLQSSQETFTSFDYNKLQICHFVEQYNMLIWMMVRESHLWTAPAIRGVQSPIEKKIEEETRDTPRIESLFKDRPENNNFINKFLKLVHQ